MEHVEIAGYVCPQGSKIKGLKYEDLLKEGELIQVISINGKKYAGGDAHSYPNNKKPIMEMDGAFSKDAGWERFDE